LSASKKVKFEKAEQPRDGLGKRPGAVRGLLHQVWPHLPIPTLLVLHHLLLPIKPSPFVVHINGIPEEFHDRLADHQADVHPRASSSVHPPFLNSRPSTRLLSFPLWLCRPIYRARDSSSEPDLLPLLVNPRRHNGRLGLLHPEKTQLAAERLSASLFSKR